jgi:hypothetical protein
LYICTGTSDTSRIESCTEFHGKLNCTGSTGVEQAHLQSTNCRHLLCKDL